MCGSSSACTLFPCMWRSKDILLVAPQVASIFKDRA